MSAARILVVVADDLGIGPQTSEGILELASLGIVTGTVLLVPSPHAAHAVGRWKALGSPCDLGWHPCLTLDAPVCPPGEVSSLIDDTGKMRPLGAFLARLLTGRIQADHIRQEFLAQYRLFRELTGQAPALINAHHHVSLFPPVGAILRDLLREQSPRPWMRRIHEPWSMHRHIRSARLKRIILNTLGRLHAVHQRRDGFPGAVAFAGIGSPGSVTRDDFFQTWIRNIRGRVIEMMCHPGQHDPTLIGRDAHPGDGTLENRARELEQLRDPAFRDAVGQAGFKLARPSQLLGSSHQARHEAA